MNRTAQEARHRFTSRLPLHRWHRVHHLAWHTGIRQRQAHPAWAAAWPGKRQALSLTGGLDHGDDTSLERFRQRRPSGHNNLQIGIDFLHIFYNRWFYLCG
ncbi:MAG: hypothetical protein M0Z50_08365 [Planctomycetia bacterium]|nr:hypothetical protein [Planctomycetia bacterium]